MNEPVYVVSGFMRTGTSMMMRALEAGGLEARYRQDRDTMKNRYRDDQYDPNLGGLYELERKDYRAFGFPAGYEGKLIKALNQGVPRMAVMPGGIRVVFMRRDAEEIRQSYDAFFGRELQNIDHLERNMADIIQRIRNRRDVLSLDVLWYRDVVDDPIAAFQTLVDSNWHIDAQAATATVEPELCRFKIEHLSVGIV